MTIPHRSALLPDENNCEEYFRREWRGGIHADAESRLKNALADWYENALWNGYGLPPSLLFKIAETLIHPHAPIQVPQYDGWTDATAQTYKCFLVKVHQSGLGIKLREAIGNRAAFEWTGDAKTNLTSALWEAILLILRRENLQALCQPLYPPLWLRNRLCQVTLLELANFDSPVAPDDPFCRSLSRLLHRHLPDMPKHCNPFFFPFANSQSTSMPTVDGAGWLADDEGCKPVLSHMLSPWGQDNGQRFNEMVAAKYRADYRLDGGGEFSRREKEFELLVKTPDASRFPDSFEAVTYGGVILPTEAAQDWELFVNKFLENRLLGMTSLEKVRAPIYIHVHFRMFLQWKDEVCESWERFPVSDHLHALMLLMAQDIILRFGAISYVILKFTLTVRRDGALTDETSFSFSAKDMFYTGNGSSDSGDRVKSDGLLLRRTQGLALFRSLPLLAMQKKNCAVEKQTDTCGIRGGHELNIYLRGENSQTKDGKLASGVLRITAGTNSTELEIYSGETWIKQELPSNWNLEQEGLNQNKERYWRKCVVHTLLGRVADTVAASQTT